MPDLTGTYLRRHFHAQPSGYLIISNHSMSSHFGIFHSFTTLALTAIILFLVPGKYFIDSISTRLPRGKLLL